MGYKFETHCHTCEVSACARRSAKEAVESYIEAGYDGIVITDHYNPEAFKKANITTKDEMAEHFLKGYREALKAANGKINIILGMEIRFYEKANDYLVYGITEEFIKKYPDMMEMGIEKFSDLAHENGMVIFQAHPFRNNMTIINPDWVDGYEVKNCNPRHDSRNEIALMWAKKFGKKMSSGSDYHQKEDVALGGVIFEKNVSDAAEFVREIMGESAVLI